MNNAPLDPPADDSADTCAMCGRDLDVDATNALLQPREMGPNRWACSAACVEALHDAWCRDCRSWVPDDGHAEDCPCVDPHERMLDAAWEEGLRHA